MGADRAVVARGPGSGRLDNFNDEIVAKLELDDDLVGAGSSWVLMARVTLASDDGDPQYATAKLVHDANVVIVEDQLFLPFNVPHCVYLQAGFVAEGRETITLQCNTYSGVASSASIIAVNVDHLFFQ